MSFDFDRLDALHDNPMKFVVVGHTNHGKTSTIRTLCEDAKFGEVMDAPRTTTGIHLKRNQINGKTTFEVYDTPGFENLDDLLLEIRPTLDTNRRPKIEEILDFLRYKGMDPQSELVRYTLEEITDCHVVIYIIDIREHVKASYKAEIECLQRSGSPLVVAFNFSKTKESDSTSWVEYLKSIGVHTYTEYDAHTRTRKDEDELFSTIKTLVHESLHKEFLDSWIRCRKQDVEGAISGSASEICEMVDDMAKCTVVRRGVDRGNKRSEEKGAVRELEKRVKERRDQCIKAIAKEFGFDWEDISNEVPENSGCKSVIAFDLFDCSRMRGIVAISGLGSVAAIGGSIDAFVGGAFFGLGALSGAVIGAVGGFVSGTAYERKYDKGASKITVRVTPPVMGLLIGCGVSAARALKVRGQANPHEVKLAFDEDAFRPSKELKEMRKKPWNRSEIRAQLLREIKAAIEK